MATTPQDHLNKQNGKVTVEGITLSVPAERVKDWDVVEGIAVMQDEASTEPEKLVASVRVMRRLFADDYERVKKELRAARDGELTADVMGEFLTGVFKALNPSA